MKTGIGKKVVPLRPKKSFPWCRLVLTFLPLILMVIIFFNQIVNRTYVVDRGSIQKSFFSEAVVVKNEILIKSPTGGNLQFLVKSGERVRVNTPLFIVTTNLGQKEEYEREIVELEKKIKSLKESSVSSLSINVIDKSIDETRKELKQAVSKGQFEKTSALKNELARLMKEKQEKIKVEESNIRLLEKALKEKRNKLQEIQKIVYSPAAGIVSFNIDGYENLLSPDTLQSLSSKQIKSINGQAIKRDAENSGQVITATAGKPVLKIVDNFTSFLVFDTGNNRLEKGKSYDVRLPATGTRVKGKVIDVYEDGHVGVILIDEDLPELFDSRKVEIEVLTENYTGNLIPTSCLVSLDGRVGVYLLEQGEKVFTPVKVIAKSGDKAIVEGLKLGDRILIKGESIYGILRGKFKKSK
ncbi:HlyD family efflux transporter periplasmic adaptor subunit [Thermoanaerobacterium sp. DL9XJH110]|uniref:HlyD family efflux transporter periplasmic adaptor subunit n=1 Tax=Thermoanaerobacterium sp. DL9XJH110 TaxID=3386643 RepID=UPI003BB48CF9